MIPFANRVEAGHELSGLLAPYHAARDVVVLGLARGGVPVAAEVARVLDVDLDVMIVRKLGAPLQPELAMGAVASGGVTVVNEDVAPWFSDSDFRAVEQVEHAELERRELLYRGTSSPPTVRNRRVILVDDGIATGASMLAAVRAVRKLGARKVIVAAPVASRDAERRLRDEADDVVCIGVPDEFAAVGQWYVDFQQTTDGEVTQLLADHRTRAAIARLAAGGSRTARSE
jgi:putative phosphoribosyl transferase